MHTAGSALQAIAGLGSLVCFILVLIQMFQHGKSGIAIISLVLLLCCGIGGLVAFIYGWVVHREWNITNIMIIWSVCVVISLIGSAMAPPDFSHFAKMP